MRLRIGVHYDLRLGSQGTDPGEPDLAVLPEHAAAVDAAGGDIVWVAERPTEPDAWIASALPVCAALAVRTKRLRVGTAVVPLLLHHPLRVAEDAATLDALSEGRFELGVGLGGDRAALSSFGIDGEDRAERLEEALELVQAAWRGPLQFGGRHFQVEGVEVAPQPVRPGGPPVWVGAGAPVSQRRAARLGAGLIFPVGTSPVPFLEAWAAGGRDPADARLAVLIPEAGSAGVASVEGWLAELPDAAKAARIDLVLSVSRSALESDEVVQSIATLEKIRDARRDRI
ncbi:MAG: LLM class flavin-dependent oxidoreductase [Myxococcota bacterium]